mmetsp:Transcript_42875/g.77905  ORF Transcript_42875/g.77905 Transcript_42875/m.77905 type:complete len:321 (-) Transcript_42875:222-1184(-)
MPHSRGMQGTSSGTWEEGKAQPYRAAFTSASLPASVRGSQAASQRLVWCHEHCHNIENRDRRQLIKQCMSEIQWGVTFLKKALQFSRWLEETECDNYVLVVGWREAQPCLRALQQARRGYPMMVVIVCISHKQYMRATAFVAGASSQRIFVQVCEYHDIPPWLMEGRIRHCFGPLEGADEPAQSSSVTVGESSSWDDGKSSNIPHDMLAQHQQLLVEGVLRSAYGEDFVASPAGVGRDSHHETRGATFDGTTVPRKIPQPALFPPFPTVAVPPSKMGSAAVILSMQAQSAAPKAGLLQPCLPQDLTTDTAGVISVQRLSL